MTPQIVGDGDIEITRLQNRNYFLAEGFRKMVKESDVWRAFLRYQSQAERLYRRAIEDFARLKSLRNEFPNEPNTGTQPEQKEELPPLEEINSRCRREPDSPAPAASSPAPPPNPADKAA